MIKIKEKNKIILSGVGPFLASILLTIEGYKANINILFYMGIAFMVLLILYIFLSIHNIKKRYTKNRN